LRSAWDRGWLAGLVLAAATVLAYLPARHAGFIWDDDDYVLTNRLLTAPDGLQRIWFSLDSPSQYFPLTYTTFRIERSVWGLNPAGYHWANILLHAVNGLLLWRLLKRLALPGAWLAAALFALHPVQVESVAWITERKNVLSLFFTLLTVRAWLEFIDGESAKPWRFYALSLACYALALSSKTTACTLPVVMGLILWLKHQPLTRRRLMELIPFFALGLIMGLVAIWWERHHQGVRGEAFGLGLVDRTLVASRAIWFYLGKLLWPVHLIFSYPRWHIDASNPIAYIWILACAMAAGAVVYARRWFGRGPEVAALFYVVTLGPLLGFIMVVTFRYSFVADHYQYVACIGPLTLLAAGFQRCLAGVTGTRPLLTPTLGGALLLVLGALTWQQTSTYTDSETLWRTALARNPNGPICHYQLGRALLEKGQVEATIAEYQTVLALDPRDGDVHYNLANVLLRSGRIDEAIPHYEAALAIHRADADAHLNLGNAFYRKGRIDDAIKHLESALQVRPDSVDAANSLAFLVWTMATSQDPSVRNGPKAVATAERADQLAGGTNVPILRAKAAAYAAVGRVADALTTAQRALGFATSQNNLTLASALQREIAMYQAQLSKQPTNTAPSNPKPGQP